MKLLAICLLAIALVFRGAPLCASPAAGTAVAAMTDCGDAAGDHKSERNQKGGDAARVCHACVSPPVVSAVFDHPMPLVAVPHVDAMTPVTGGMIAPPTPPPRAASVTIIQNFNGVIS